MIDCCSDNLTLFFFLRFYCMWFLYNSHVIFFVFYKWLMYLTKVSCVSIDVTCDTFFTNRNHFFLHIILHVSFILHVILQHSFYFHMILQVIIYYNMVMYSFLFTFFCMIILFHFIFSRCDLLFHTWSHIFFHMISHAIIFSGYRNLKCTFTCFFAW